MKKLLLLTAILLTGCMDVEIELDAKSPESVRRQTIWDRLAHYLRDTFLPVLFPV